jgi:5-methylcytosine-specific restriction endonuclease McrA
MPASKSLNVENIEINTHFVSKNYERIQAVNSFDELISNETVFITIPQIHNINLYQNATLLLKVIDLYWAIENIKLIKSIDEHKTGTYYVQPIEPSRSSLRGFADIYRKQLNISVCSYCDSRPFTDVDHIYPWSIIKRDEFWNMLPICKKCNSNKSNKIIDITESQYILLECFIGIILDQHREKYSSELYYRSVIDGKNIGEVSTSIYLLDQTKKRLSNKRDY